VSAAVAAANEAADRQRGGDEREGRVGGPWEVLVRGAGL
jgi:hypothetical protein